MDVLGFVSNITKRNNVELTEAQI
uniref:Uncharacterized protein n=1 Tax=Anguilla anguilla TaxID=7936 RepID=A0A0E9Q2S8_ANGAN